jgi:hypothetical protein
MLHDHLSITDATKSSGFTAVKKVLVKTSNKWNNIDDGKDVVATVNNTGNVRITIVAVEKQ